MGLTGWYRLLKTKGYEPTPLSLSALPATVGPWHLNLLGTLFRVISRAYSDHDQAVANIVVEAEIKKFGEQDTLHIYIDGAPAEEKKVTSDRREERRLDALEKVNTNVQQFEARVKGGARVRKQNFVAIKAGLHNTFYWSLDSRMDLRRYLEAKGWTVVPCDTEADLEIARRVKEAEVVISGDSDLLAYQGVSRLWRPIARGQLLVYDVPTLLNSIGLTRSQLTALAVVSRNDYHRNIFSLGPATNFGIIKELKGKGNMSGKMFSFPRSCFSFLKIIIVVFVLYM